MVYSVNGKIFHFGIYVSDCPIIGLLINLELTRCKICLSLLDVQLCRQFYTEYAFYLSLTQNCGFLFVDE